MNDEPGCNEKEEAEETKRRASLKKAMAATDWHSLGDIHTHQARIIMSKYKALKRQGFSEHEVLYLCLRSWEI